MRRQALRHPLGVRGFQLDVDRRDVPEEQVEQALEIGQRHLEALAMCTHLGARRARRVVHALQQVADRMLDVVQHVLAHGDETLVDARVARRHRSRVLGVAPRHLAYRQS